MRRFKAWPISVLALSWALSGCGEVTSDGPDGADKFDSASGLGFTGQAGGRVPGDPGERISDGSSPVCDPAVATEEKCDGVDNDCDGVIDEPGAAQCTLYFADLDGDGFGDEQDGECLCAPSGTMTAQESGDCDDAAQSIHPNGIEICNDLDDDCDGATDPPGADGCQIFYRDQDGDGVAGNESGCLCAIEAGWLAEAGGDCDDADTGAGEVQPEACNGLDDDCDGEVDSEGAIGCLSFYLDEDGDGFGTGDGKCLCGASPPWSAVKAGDCDDGNGAVSPGKEEVCGNGVDDDCAGGADNACAAEVCYPGVNATYNVCFDLVPASTVEQNAAYLYPDAAGVSEGLDPAQYTPPAFYIAHADTDPQMKIAKNFKFAELMKDHGAQYPYAMFQVHAVEKVQGVRDALGLPLYITSGYRSPGYNQGIEGSATYSRHMYGDAVDCHAADAVSLEAVQAACIAQQADWSQGPPIYTGHVHCDWREHDLDTGFFAGMAGLPGGWVELVPRYGGSLHTEGNATDGPLKLWVTWWGFDEGTPHVRWTVDSPTGHVLDATGTSLVVQSPEPGTWGVEVVIGGVAVASSQILVEEAP